VNTPSSKPWDVELRAVYDRGIAAWKQGQRSPQAMFSPDDAKFLASIGCSTQELFDFVDDFLVYGEPSLAAVQAIQAIRRDYFLNQLQGKSTGQVACMESLPPKAASVDGFPWLPRVIEKARLKLRGEMPPDLMYGCGGDRAFFAKIKMTLPRFLEVVRDAGDNSRVIIDAVKASAETR